MLEVWWDIGIFYLLIFYMGDFMILYDINYNIYVINNVEINISFYVRR